MRTFKQHVNIFARNLVSAFAKRVVIRNFNEAHQGKQSQRALVSYLVHPLLPPSRFRDHVMFSNRGIAQAIPKVLNELGYIVDIVNYNNTSWLPASQKQYDLFIGHGGTSFDQISQRLPKTTVQIYFSTGLYWQEANIREAERIYKLAQRRGYFLPLERTDKADEEYANQIADAIICLGNAHAIKSYHKFPKVIGINNGVFPVNWNGMKNKNYESGKKHFMFFSGRGNVHKGLDILLEVFSKIDDLHLHICQWIEPDFGNVYKKELTEHANIHVYGFVKMRSRQFDILAQTCNWIILPTCAEGQPGSVLECMAYGLIPILPDSANIDLEDWGIRLQDVEIDIVRTIVQTASETSAEECYRQASSIVNVAHNIYSPQNFQDNFKKAVIEIIEYTKRNREYS